MGRFILVYLVPLIAAPLYWLLTRTWRFEITGDATSLKKYHYGREPVNFAFWHGDELVLLGLYSFRRLAVLSSLSKDGTIMANVLKLLGYQVFRGSSSKGGAKALINLIRTVKSGSQSSLAVDGPKGPIFEVKPGIADLALKTKMPIVTARCSASSVWYIPRAWNGSYVPKPFAKVKVHFSAAHSVAAIAENKNKTEKKQQQGELCQWVKHTLDQAPLLKFTNRAQ